MNRITPEHLAREAYVYVRQSTADQLLNNPESRRRQWTGIPQPDAERGSGMQLPEPPQRCRRRAEAP